MPEDDPREPIDEAYDDVQDAIVDAGAKTESDSGRDGFMSYAAETHAIGHGLYEGLTSRRLSPATLPDNKDVQAEPQYYKGAYVLGTLLQVAIPAALAILGHGAIGF